MEGFIFAPMRTLLITITVLITFLSKAQRVQEVTDISAKMQLKAAEELKTFAKLEHTSNMLMLAGTGMSAVSLVQPASGKSLFLILGGALYLGGVITKLTAPAHMRKAGIYLDASARGVTVKLPLQSSNQKMTQ